MDDALRNYLPALAMVALQLGFAGLNIVSKVAMDAGMSPYVMVAYRQVVATLFLSPIAFLSERRTMMNITRKVVFQIFLCSIFGATLNQLLYFLGLKLSTPTVACALNNTLPAITFMLAALLRMEAARIRTMSGAGKVLGTAVCVGGSMLMTFYKGALVRLPPSGIHWSYVERIAAGGGPAAGRREILGAALVVASCLAWAIWFIVQAKMSRNFASPYTSSALMCFAASIQCLAIAAAVERKASAWAVGWDIRLLASVYTGVVCSGLAFALMSWCIERRGPLYVSMFSPLLLVIVAVLGWAVLDEKLYFGSVVGSFLIVAGLYLVLWGKQREQTEFTAAVGDEGALDEEKGAEAAPAGETRGAIALPLR